MPRLVGQGGIERRQLRVRRTARDARNSIATLTPGARQEDGADLDEREVAVAATQIAQRRGEQTGQQRCTQLRFVLGERIHQPERPPPRIVRRQAELVVHARRDEGVGQHFDEARGGDGAGDRAHHRLPAGESVAGGRGG